MSNLENMTLIELKKLAKENNIRNISKLKKEELIDILREVDEVENNNEEVEEKIEQENETTSKVKKYDAADVEAEEEDNVEEAVYQRLKMYIFHLFKLEDLDLKQEI